MCITTAAGPRAEDTEGTEETEETVFTAEKRGRTGDITKGVTGRHPFVPVPPFVRVESRSLRSFRALCHGQHLPQRGRKLVRFNRLPDEPGGERRSNRVRQVYLPRQRR
jgi:hypothetical protein